jgi:DNA polymerase-3 subunit gamma/tau
MENFIVSARKYRPTTFESVVGQGSITVTLKNAINNNHLAHAYLFCGPRGVGKTTCARIFAKTINCFNLNESFEACDECESCISFNEQRSYNIPPQIGKHSVYIIDEVHMLSASAFNAFLKTLEEPPAHAIFVLATTEKHKILPTILSRCQIFDFSRMTIENTVNHLSNVAAKENITVDLDGLNIIAQKADGAMRDALSIFDQIVSFSGKNISYKNVIDNLNVLDYDYYFKLTEHLLESNIASTLLVYNDILNKGFDGHHFIGGLCSHFRDLLVCTDAATVSLLEVGANIKENYKVQAPKCGIDFLYQALNIANTCDINYKTSRNPRLLVELTLMQLCYIKKKSLN